MSEFITSYPLFSYIAVPVLLILLVVLLVLTLRPKHEEWDYFAGLYDTTLEAIEFIDAKQKIFSAEELRVLLRTLSKLRQYYEMLQSEELYEVESVILNIQKASSITRALIAARASEGEIADYLMDISNELKAIRKTLYGFNLTRANDEVAEFAPLPNINQAKVKKRAKEYLASIKHDK